MRWYMAEYSGDKDSEYERFESDMVDHSKPRRDTGSYRENNWARIMDGHELVDRVTAKVMDMVGGLVLA